MKKILGSSLVIGAFLLTGCGTNINLAKYSPINAPKAPHMPSQEELNNKKPNVIVMDIDDNDIEVAKEAKAGKAMAAKINEDLGASNEVRIVKRLNNINLKDEVKKTEVLKSLGDNSANYIVTGKINNATYKWEFNERKIITDKKGRVHVIPPFISYEACVSGNVEVYKLPELELQTSIPVKACTHEREDARSPYEAKKKNPSLVREAAVEAADDAKYPLMNFFAPKGYITEIRKNKDGDLIAKITIGSADGLKEGDKVKIYTIEDSVNQLTNKKESHTIQIGVGKVSNQIAPHFAWIIIEEVEPNKTLHIGDFAKVEKEESLISKALKVIN